VVLERMKGYFGWLSHEIAVSSGGCSGDNLLTACQASEKGEERILSCRVWKIRGSVNRMPLSYSLSAAWRKI